MDVNKKKKALKELSRVFKFELWIRFYFLQETDDKLQVFLSEEQMNKIHEEYGELADLVKNMTKVNLTPEASQKAIVEFIGEKYDGTKYNLGTVPEIMNSAGFRAEVEVFNMWVSLHEQQLDENFLPFHKWEEAFEEWKGTEQAKKIITSFTMGQKGVPTSSCSN